jgi:ABC-type antimicrobial peptide transport system permease subunit
MLRNYFKTAWRNLVSNKVHSFINIAGLSVGMTVAMLIGLWIWDELSFDKYHQHYNSIAEVMEKDTYKNDIHTGAAIPLPLDAELRKSYGGDFKHIAMASWTDPHVLSIGDKNISYQGNFIGAEAPEMFTLHMLEGARNGLRGPSSMLISQSVAKALFGNTEAINQLIKIDNKITFKVSGVYEDLPANTTLHDIAFMAPWDFYVTSKDLNGRDPDNWNDNSLFMYVQIADNADMAKVSEKIKNIKQDKINQGEARSKPEMFLQPMSKWHLYSEFKNGVNTGGAIQYVKLFSVIAIFVLLLACINFMNLSTARSQKRAREVGVRKAIGSLRMQLIIQFFCESLLMVFLAFGFSLLLSWLALPLFNQIADKQMAILWSNPVFWLISISFVMITSFIAGSYPAFYLSSFKPIKVLKGTFKAGRFASVPRKALVVLQFSVSVILIIGTIIVFRQIQFAKNRPVGYNREGLVNIEMINDDLSAHFNPFRFDLLKTGAIKEMAESNSYTTGVNYTRDDLNWQGKDPSINANFGNIVVTTEYGKTVGWQFISGRDFSTKFITDSSSLVLNEAAVKYMGLKNAVGEIIRVGKKDYTVIGVIRDMVMGSPYEPVQQTIFRMRTGSNFDDIIIRINPKMSAHDAISKIETVCKAYSPSVPFSYKFVDDEYAKKFSNEERIGKLTTVFAVLAIFISCLGLFGMASFMAEQRTKEIGVRKIMGASVANLWGLLSKEFVFLVILSCVVAIPIANYFLHEWLQRYEYRTEMSWWIFAIACAGALMITLLTVSYQTIKAALANPVKSLRTE